MSGSDPVRILYMEDDAGLARILQKTLQRQGYFVDIASDGEEGLAMFDANPYDILLVDYNMPVYGGIDVIRTLASKGSLPPTIMVTGQGSEKVAAEALKLGATDYIVKDVEMGYLELIPIVIEQALQKQQLIMERQKMFEEIQESEERYRRLVELSPNGILVQHEEKLTFANSAGNLLLGVLSFEQLMTKSLLDFVHPDYKKTVSESLKRGEKQDNIAQWIEGKLIRHGTEVDVEIAATPFRYKGESSVQVIVRDVTARKAAQRKLEYMAHFDAITGLPNRMLFFDRLNQTLALAKRYEYMFALLFLDLDRFKLINDTMGHDIGDLLLKETANRLGDCLRNSDTAARMSGDEFTIILTQINSIQGAEVVAHRIITSIATPFQLKDHTCSVSASIGISVYPLDGIDADTLLKNADTAMYRVKEQGRNNYQLFSEI